MRSHGNISVFVPHIGCPNRCSFCNQNTITGQVKVPSGEDVKAAVLRAANHKNYCPENTEIAFFGGSFTKIKKDLMLELLEAGYEFVKNKTVSGIRISTRPDGIDTEILGTLKSFGVTAIELGCQSMDNEVLKKNFRGHSEDDVYCASKLIKAKGFSLGLQMMTGLYGDTEEKAMETLEKIIKISPDTLRIYPTLVLKNTYLEKLLNEGKYSPQNVEEAALLVSKMLIRLKNTGIKVIRVGLHDVDKDGFIKGPWHPAFGEICVNYVYRQMLSEIIEKQKIPKGDIVVYVPKGDVSKMAGHKKSNIEFFGNIGYNCKIVEENIKEISAKQKTT